MVNQQRRDKISIVIVNHYRPLVAFSMIGAGGLYEILRLYVEIVKMYRCVPGPTAVEALSFSTNYTLVLVPTIRIYPLLPPTINPRDTWVLKGKDADLFAIRFEWPRMMAVDVVIRAEVHDHIHNERKTISSEIIRLQRNGEDITPKEFVPDDNAIPLTPYLYKLVTIDGFIEKVNFPEAAQLNREAYQEIVSLFHCKTLAEFEGLLREKPKYDLMFEADVHPMIAERLIEIAPTLRRYITNLDPLSSTPITILFLAADPTNASRLRLGEEFREIDEQLTLAKQRERFHLALPHLSLRPKDIARVLLNVQPQIVHFSGHGTPEGALCFEDESGKAHFVQPEALSALFKQFVDQTKCVILNACYAENQAIAIAKHIDYVIGMKQEISDEAAIAFSRGFYLALGAGKTIEEAFEFGRIQIMLQGVPEHLVPVLIKKSQIQP
ncbi:MAG: CHAT domain-containing protein [Candidatus Methanomethylicaceae archaeon]